MFWPIINFFSGFIAQPSPSVPHENVKTATFKGRMSTFGGPADLGVSPSEGLSLIEQDDVRDPQFRDLFLPHQPPGTTGLARRLDPDKYYIAMRWAHTAKQAGTKTRFGKLLPIVTSRDYLRRVVITLKANGRSVQVRAVDTGPDEEESKGRICDVSPGVAKFLHLQTDDEVTIEIPLE